MRTLQYLLIAMLLVLSAPAMAARPDLGTNCPRLHGYQFFSPDHPWNKDISNDPVDPGSDAIIAFYGGSSQLIHCDFGPTSGIPYAVVSGTQRKVRMVGASGNNGEADLMMFPIPPNVPIEGGGDGGSGDSHCLVLDRDNNLVYETWVTRRMNGGKYFTATFGCIFNLRTSVLRPMPWSSADAAGLSVLAGLCRGDEVIDDGVINHPIRFVVENSKMSFVAPATHKASPFTGPNYLPMGARLRLKGSLDISWLPTQARVIATAMQKYGLILADNGGNFYVCGSPDSRWDVNHLNTLDGFPIASFELVKRGVEYRY